eukprot:COSAG02_NODE_1791_length_10920_cov_62.356067_5_plen_80_part_00
MAAMNSAARSLNHRRISPVEALGAQGAAGWTLSMRHAGYGQCLQDGGFKAIHAIRFLHRLTRGHPEARGAAKRTNSSGS